MPRRIVLGMVVWLVVAAGKVDGQILPDSLVGSRVRVQLARQDRSLEGFTDRQKLRGTLTRVSRDSVAIRVHPDASTLAIAANGVYQIDVSRGVSRSRTALKGALWGAAYFAGLSAITDDELGGGSTENLLIWTGGGLVIGAFLGAIMPQERWKRVFRR